MVPPKKPKAPRASAKTRPTSQPSGAAPAIPADDGAFTPLDEAGEPPAELIVEEWNDLNQDGSLELSVDELLTGEISEDPVRLYLKDIGQISLLESVRQFASAARIEAYNLLNQLAKKHADNRRALFEEVGQELVAAWNSLAQNASRMQAGALPDLIFNVGGGAASAPALAAGDAFLSARTDGQRAVGTRPRVG